MLKISVFLLGLFCPILTGIYFFHNLTPSPEEIRSCMITKMNDVNLCPESPAYVTLKNISPFAQKAIILSEDSGFYQHGGFEWTSIDLNFWEGWHSGNFKRGGSTITQQLAKNLFLTKEKTFKRKLREAFIADAIEKNLTKKEILERYLNVVEFGENIFGISAASKYYFKKKPAELDLVESAFLALILPNPKKYASSFHKQELSPFARSRITEILDKLVVYEMISIEQYSEASQKLTVFLKPKTPQIESIEAVTDEEEEQNLPDHLDDFYESNFL